MQGQAGESPLKESGRASKRLWWKCKGNIWSKVGKAWQRLFLQQQSDKLNVQLSTGISAYRKPSNAGKFCGFIHVLDHLII